MSVRDVLDRTDLAGVLTELAGEPVSAGRLSRWRCCASDHPDDNPSVTMFRDRHGVERWRCWSGGHGGTAIDAVMAARGVTTADAVRQLEQRAGITPPVTRPVAPPTVAARPVAFSAPAHAYATACAELLWTRQGGRALDWLHQRGLSDDVLRTNLVGYDPGHLQLARPKGVPGFRLPHHTPLPAVTYPSFSPAGHMIYVQARYLADGAPSKYANPSAAHGQLPAVSYPKTPLRQIGPVIVTEGVPDGLVAVTAGFRPASVLSTSLVTTNVADELAGHAGNAGVILAFDNDPAGRTAETTLRELLTGRVPVKILRLADGQDLTDSFRPPTPTRSLAAATAGR